MNFIILLVSLLSTYVDTPLQQEPFSAVLSRPASAELTFEQTPNSSPYISRFETLSGTRLFTTEMELLAAKGDPIDIVSDPWQGCMEYQYEDMSAGVCNGAVIYVHVNPTQARMNGLYLNGVEIDPVKNNLREILGSPDFRAEDGDVYMRGSTALKIYRDTESGEWLGVDLFDEYSS